MTARGLPSIHGLLMALAEPTAEMQALRQALTSGGRFPARRTWERRLGALVTSRTGRVPGPVPGRPDGAVDELRSRGGDRQHRAAAAAASGTRKTAPPESSRSVPSTPRPTGPSPAGTAGCTAGSSTSPRRSPTSGRARGRADPGQPGRQPARRRVAGRAAPGGPLHARRHELPGHRRSIDTARPTTGPGGEQAWCLTDTRRGRRGPTCLPPPPLARHRGLQRPLQGGLRLPPPGPHARAARHPPLRTRRGLRLPARPALSLRARRRSARRPQALPESRLSRPSSLYDRASVT